MTIRKKFFCIGLNKTGTSSLHKAFQILGFNSVHHICDEGYLQDIMIANNAIGNPLLKGIDHYDVYSDWTMTTTRNFFKILDDEHPNCKFIFNTRNIEDWIKSREFHVKSIKNLKTLQKENPDNTWYNLQKDLWRKEFLEHEKEVKRYFENREQDILFFDVTKGDGWQKLCKFLNVKEPNVSFPHMNKKKSFLKKKLKEVKSFFKNG